MVDATPENLADGSANGFVFAEPDSTALAEALERAIALYRRPREWMKLIKTGMQAEHGWRSSAQAYLDMYRAQ